MPTWLSRHDDGRHFQKHPRTRYDSGSYQTFSQILRDEAKPDTSVKTLQTRFETADHSEKVKIKRALVQQANIEKQISQNNDYSPDEKKEALRRHLIFKSAYEKMDVSKSSSSSTGLRGKPGKAKRDFDKEMVDKAVDKAAGERQMEQYSLVEETDKICAKCKIGKNSRECAMMLRFGNECDLSRARVARQAAEKAEPATEIRGYVEGEAVGN